MLITVEQHAHEKICDVKNSIASENDTFQRIIDLRILKIFPINNVLFLTEKAKSRYM